MASIQQPFLHRRVPQPTDHFPVFYPASTAQTVFSFEFLPTNQNSLSICCRYISIFNAGVRCYDERDFRNLPFSFLFVSLFSSCLSLSLISFSYMFLSFPLPYGRLLKPSTGIPNNLQRSSLGYFSCSDTPNLRRRSLTFWSLVCVENSTRKRSS